MNCDSCDEPKYSFTTADTGFALMRSCGISVSISCDMLMRSLIARVHANQADAVLVLHELADRATRRLPRWSMSSTEPRPFFSSIK